jgi:outer membrane protein assembly factor BamB
MLRDEEDAMKKPFFLILSGCLAGVLGAELPTALSPVVLSGIQQPEGATQNDAGVFLVSSPSQGVRMYSTAGVPVGTFGGTDPNAAVLAAPKRLEYCSSGRVLVVSPSNNSVGVFSADGSLLFSLGVETVEDPQEDPAAEPVLYQPGDAAFGSDGNIYVADTGHNRVAVFSGTDGSFMRAWGGLGYRGEQAFYLPMGIAAKDGKIYVADAGNGRIMCFAEDGTFLQQYGYRGLGQGEFDSPFDVAVDNQGYIWAVDNGLQKVAVFNAEGQSVKEYVEAGGESFDDLVSIQLTSRGTILISDAGRNKIYSSDPGVRTESAVKAPEKKGALADLTLAFGPVPARAGQPLVLSLPFKVDAVEWEMLGVDMRRAAHGDVQDSSTAVVPDTGHLASGVYILRSSVRRGEERRTQIQKVIITR